MFMQYRGGGIGHKITCEWDEFLQSDGAWVVKEDGEEEGDGDDVEDRDEEEEEEEGGMGMRERKEMVPDRIETDEGEELDDIFMAEEGYSAL
jgi:hypothetical protein